MTQSSRVREPLKDSHPHLGGLMNWTIFSIKLSQIDLKTKKKVSKKKTAIVSPSVEKARKTKGL